MQSPAEQHEENAEAAEANGWTLGKPYEEDEGISASRIGGGKVRPGFIELIADLGSGQFAADVLILWEASRGSRQTSEWVALIELAEKAGVVFFVTSEGKTYDPAVAIDRKALIVAAADAEYESSKTSLRIRRTARRLAREGKPHGRVPFGYFREYGINEKGKRYIKGQFRHPDEAPVIEELFGRLAKHEALHSIARDFAERGILTRARCEPGCQRVHKIGRHSFGQPFSPTDLRSLALLPLYAGLRAHEPGNRSGRYHGSLASAVKATWEPVVTREQFEAVREFLLDPGRRTSRPGQGIHLLSLIGECGVCGGGLSVRYKDGRRLYFCRSGNHVRVLADDLDGLAEDVMLAYLAQPDVIRQLRVRPEGGDAALAAAEEAASTARDELAALQRAAAARQVDVSTLLAVEPGLQQAVRDAEHRVGKLRTPTPLLAIPPGKDVARRWTAAEMPARREVARLLCSGGILGRLALDRVPRRGHPCEVQDRVRWVRDIPAQEAAAAIPRIA